MLVLLMSLSLIGIIFLQAYYISNSVKNKEEQFEFNVKKALSFVSRTVEDNEFKKYSYLVQDMLAEGRSLDSSKVNLTVIQEDTNSNVTWIYRYGILEENYKLSSSFFDISLDSSYIKKVINEREVNVYKNSNPSDMSAEARLFQLSKTSKSDRFLIDDYYRDASAKVPIHKRVSEAEIRELLKKKLALDGIDIDFEFAIYSNDLATKIQSENFDLQKKTTYEVPIFPNEESKRNYRLLVNFPDHDRFILSSVIGMTLLSVVFTLIIIIAYSSALFQLLKQKKISEIKSDFINNMTHEFKTPIATINLALDAIKNPKIMEDSEKVARYLGMIKEENKRMHAQVENVLRISKLEKNDLDIRKENLDLHDLIEDAITHVQLMVEDRNGYIHKHFEAVNTSVLANESHFTNVIVNILDNAIKYSPEAPKIDVFTENAGNNIILKIKDQGSGMTKAAQKRVFEKFYRETTGNIHNVKGHGLGLAYVKRIVDDHQGYITVESEKDKGSTFTIKLPLIS